MSNAVTLGVCALVTLLWAAKRNWFGVPRKAAYAVPLGLAAVNCAVCAALLALFVLTLVKCLRMKNALGALVALSVSLSLGVRIVTGIMSNLGYILMAPECPLLSGNLHTAIDMGLIGVMLSVFRQEKLPETARPLTKRLERFCRVRWRDGKLTISFRPRGA